MSEPQEPKDTENAEATGQDEPSLDELFPDVELGEAPDSSEGYQNHDELDHDLDALMGRFQEDDTPSPAAGTDHASTPTAEAEEAIGADEPEIDLDAELEMEDSPAPSTAAPEPPLADGEIPVLQDKVDPTRMPHAGLSDNDLGKLAELLTADLEARLDTIIVEAVDHEMDRVSTALKNAIHRQLKGRLPDIIAEFVSETRRL